MEVDVEPLPGSVLAELSTGMVRFYRRFYGRGPTRARTIADGDVVTTVLEEVLTTVERTLVERGHARLVTEVRATCQASMVDELAAEVERVTGRPVLSLSSGVDVAREIATETCVLAPVGETAAVSGVVRQADPRQRDGVRAQARETRDMSAAVRAQARQARRRLASGGDASA